MSEPAVNSGDVIGTLSPNDEMLAGGGGEEWYHAVGRSALECVTRALDAAGLPVAEVARILDLPCGHGRVLRYLRAAFPHAKIAACDLSRDAVDFCAATFGAVPVYSADDPSQIPLEPASFDFIWVGSLFTHFDAQRWAEFLGVLGRCLRPGGVLVFSSHGRTVYRQMAEGTHPYLDDWRRVHIVVYQYERTGFGYADYLGQNGYGISLASPAWVCGQLSRLPELRLVHVCESAWVGLHDVFACVRDPEARPPRPTVSTFAYVKRRVGNALARAGVWGDAAIS